MHVISKKLLRDFYGNNTQSEKPLVEWYYRMKECKATNLTQLRRVFNNSADPVNGYTVFNIGGNNYRLIASVHYNRQRCYIRAIWTHAKYSDKRNQDKLKRGEL